jgi:ABC-type polysaccharide/polyol phosphate export permease
MTVLNPQPARAEPAPGEALTATLAERFPTPELALAAEPPRHTVLGDLREIVHDLHATRELLLQLTMRDIRVRYKQAVFGFAWAVLMPMLVVGAGLVVRVAMAVVSGRALNAEIFAGMMIKSVAWAFFIGTINFATPSLVSSITLVTKVYFPREVLPLSALLAQTFDSSVNTVLVMIALPLLGVQPTWQLLWVPLLVVSYFALAAAAALFLSCANIFFRDVKYLVSTAVSFGIFFTPIFFDPAMFGARGAKILMLNPLSPFLEGLRLSIVQHHNLLEPLVAPNGALAWHPLYLAYGLSAAWLGLLFSAILFHRAEYRFAELV